MSVHKHRIAVTGIGIINANGNNVEEYWQNVVDGKSGIKVITTVDMSDLSTKVGGEVADFRPEDHFTPDELKNMDRCGQFAVLAAREAVKFANLDLNQLDPYRTGVIIGTSLGGMKSGEKFHEQWINQGINETDEKMLFIYPVHTPCDNIAHNLGLKGPRSVISNACAAGTNSIGFAIDTIREGKADVMLTGGVDPLTHLSICGFNSLQALCPEASSPYSKSHGVNIGEGAGILVLERMDKAIERGATILAEVLDYDLSADSYHQTAPDPGGAGAVRSMRGALDKANLTEEDISYINGHGTGTPTNDASEPKALRTVIKDLPIPISSNKSMIGHMLGAAGAAEGVTSVLAINRGFIPPTVNFDPENRKFDLDFVPNQGREADLDVVLSNSFAFGGNNATVLFSKFKQDQPLATELPRKRVVLTGVGALAGNAANLNDIYRLLQNGESGISQITDFDPSEYGHNEAGQVPDLPYNKLINPTLIRKMDTLSKQAVASTKMALDDAKLKITRANGERMGVIFATGTGPIETVEAFNRVLVQEGAKMANAKLFPNTVMNAAAGHICLNFKIKGPTSTITAGNVSALNALYYAYTMIQTSSYDTFVVVSSDEFNEPVLAGHSRLPNYLTKDKIRPFAENRSGVVLGGGSVAFVVETEEAALARGAHILAELKGFGLTSDTKRVAAINQSGEEWAKSFELALADAGLAADAIDYVASAANGHGKFDQAEARAISNVFGKNVPVSAPKSVFGDTHGTSGALGLISALCALNGTIPATQNVDQPMEDLGFDLVTGASRQADAKNAVITSYAYGGNYNTIVIGRYES